MAPAGESRRRRGAIPLVRIAGIQVTIDFSWFIVVALILWSLSVGYFPRTFPGQTASTYWFAGVVASFFFFASVVMHEVSHSLMAIRSGISIPEITLFLFGGVSQLSEEPTDPIIELKIALVGPLSSFGLAVLFWGAEALVSGWGFPLWTAIFGYLVWINIALGVFNLIPGFPLDGGRALRAIIWWKTGSMTRATKWASDLGKGLAVALIVLGGLQIFSGLLIGGLWMIFIGIFLRGVAESGYQELVMRQSLEGVHVAEVMIPDVVSVPPDLTVKRLITDFFLRYGYKGFPVIQDGRTLGMISISDVKDIPAEEQESKTVTEAMRVPDTEYRIDPDLSLAQALKKMTQEDLGQLLVMEGDRMIGMITKTGLMRFIEIKRILER